MRDVSVYLDKISLLRDFSEGAERLIVTLTSVADGTILWVSDGLRPVLGYDPEEVTGTPALSLLATPAETTKFGNALAVVGAGETTAGLYEAKHRDGHVVTLRVTGWLVSDDVAVSLSVPDRQPSVSVTGRR